MQHQALNPYFLRAEVDYRRGKVIRQPRRSGGERRFRLGRRHGGDR